jgi:hypothetical protein
MQPTAMRWLAATWSLLPKAEAEMICGQVIVPIAAARKPRREWRRPSSFAQLGLVFIKILQARPSPTY